MWLNINDSSIIAKPKAVVVDGVQYPSVIFSKWSEVELNTIGVFTIIEDTIPNRRYYTYNEVLDTITATITRTPIEKPLADVQAVMIRDLEDTANNKFNEATVGYTAGEMAGWRELEDEAKSHATTPLTSGMLFDEATYSGITVDSLVAKVLANAAAFKQMKSYISGTRKRKSTEIMGLIDVNSCIAYENFAYNYTITAEDVAADNTLTLGEVVPRIRNKVKDWTL
jgi:hypothetical protein